MAAYLDSVYQAFNNPKNEAQKLDAALQLTKHFTVNEERLDKLSEKLEVAPEEIRSWELLFNTYIEAQLEKPAYQSRRLEYEMLKVNSLDEVLNIAPRLNQEPETYTRQDSSLKAIWLMRRQFYTRREQDVNSPHLVRRLIKLAPKIPENLGLVSNACKLLGDEQYHKRQLDSAAYYYQIAVDIYRKKPGKKVVYTPFFGVHSRTEATVNILMNLGLVNERKGNLARASQCYEEANAIYQNKNREGVHWSNLRLMNAYFDMGDSSSAVAQLREIAKGSLTELKGLRRYSPRYISNVLAELNLQEVKDHVVFLDSLLSDELNYLYANKPINGNEAQLPEDAASTYYRAKLCHYNILLHSLQGIENTEQFNWAELNFLVAHYLKKSKEDPKKFAHAGAMESLPLAWGIAQVNGPIKADEFNYLLDLFAAAQLSGEGSYALQQAIWAMHIHGRHEQELALLEILEPAMTQTSHRVGRKYVYGQLAKVHEAMGNYKAAINYRDKHDQLAASMQSMLQYESLAELDKKLEVAKAKSEQIQLQLENNALKARRQRLTLTIAALSVILILGAGLFWANRRRIEARKKQLEAENELLEAGLKSEEEKVRLASLEILKSNQSFSQLITDVEQLKGDLSPENRKKVLGLLINYKTKAQDDIWQQFNLQFQSHYQSFYQNLATRFPELTENEQRLCAMHLSNLTNKEINAITGQKLSSIHTMKSKVRKKLGVENDRDLLASLQGMV